MILGYSSLAWELAHHCKFHGGTDGWLVHASLPTFTLLDDVESRGNTTTEAMQNLACEIDRISSTAPVIPSGEEMVKLGETLAEAVHDLLLSGRISSAVMTALEAWDHAMQDRFLSALGLER